MVLSFCFNLPFVPRHFRSFTFFRAKFGLASLNIVSLAAVFWMSRDAPQKERPFIKQEFDTSLSLFVIFTIQGITKAVSLILVGFQLGIYLLDKNSVPGFFYILFGSAEEVFVLIESLS